MKKLLAIAIVLVGLFTLCLNVRNDVETPLPSHNVQNENDVEKSPTVNAQDEVKTSSLKLSKATSSENELEEELTDNKLTLELLNQMSSWEELMDTALPIAKSYRGSANNKEDFYCITFIGTLEGTENNVGVVFDLFCYDLERLEENIDKERLKRKYETIVDIYDSSCYFQGWIDCD